MRLSTRRRLVVSIALIISGIAVTFAAADSLINTHHADKSQSGDVGQIAGASGAEPDATGDVLGAQASSEEPRVDKDRTQPKHCNEERRCEGSWGDAARGGEAVAALMLTGDDGSEGGGAPTCADTNSCVDHIRELIPSVRERVDDVLSIHECISSIGGEAACFSFADGSYLVADGPKDGEAELGFCTSSGYYYVSAPAPEPGTRSACPDGPAAGGGEAPRGHEPSAVRDCTSSVGGEATCFGFSGGTYLLSDSLQDGEGELGFCTRDGYYFVAGPSAEGGTGGACPDAATKG
jgi:hypothetical protein